MFIAQKHIYNIDVIVAFIRKIEQKTEGHFLGVQKDLMARLYNVYQKQELKLKK